MLFTRSTSRTVAASAASGVHAVARTAAKRLLDETEGLARLLVLLLITACLTCSLRAVTHSVSTAAEFNALPTLNAGDVVILASGSYGALDKTLVSSISSDSIAQTNPIHVIAAEPGGVDVTAPSFIELEGRGIVLAGLDFVAGSGMKDNGSTSPAALIRLDTNSRYMTVSNIRFLNCTAGDDYGHWIEVRGFHHTIEYCSFEGKNEPNANATVGFKRNTSEAGISTPREHVMRRCYFGPREASETDNGYETIRIGDSSSQAHEMRVTIEENVFYRAIWREDGDKPNEMEIISNKTKGNRILNNTFLESFGQITLRHGDACLVEGNYILGGGSYSGSSIVLNPANPYQSGVRVIGEDHVVRNNYLVNLDGTNLRAAVCVMGGVSGWNDGDGSGGDNGYEPAHSAQIYNNTFIDCKELNLGYLNSGSVLPTGVQVFNNAWQGSGSDNGIVRDDAFSLGDSGGNYIYHPSSEYGWTGLNGTYSSDTSPDVSESFDDYLIPTATSPLLDAADPTLSPSDDVRKLARPGSGRDIGCFERELSGSGARPLYRNEVGPEFDGGPAGTYPDPGNLIPTIVTTTLPHGALTAVYNQSLIAVGGDAPLTWSLSTGALPAGISLSGGGVLTGTPTSTGTSDFTVRVVDGDGDEDTQALSLVVDAEPGTEPVKFSLSGSDVSASSAQSGNGPENTVDGDPDSRWSAQGDGEWIRYDLGAVMNVQYLEIAWHNGDSRTATFDLEVSNDDTNWTPVATGLVTSGSTDELQTADLPDSLARYVRIVGHGNSTNLWNSISETEVWGTLAVPPAVPGGLAATPTDGQVSLSWGDSNGASQYHLKRSTVGGSGYSSVASISGTSHVDTGVVNGITYYYVVSAENATGESIDSGEESAKPFAPVSSEEMQPPGVAKPGANVELKMQSVVGRVYQLQRSDELNPPNWVNIGSPVTGDGSEILLEDPDASEVPRRFYRVSIVP